MCTKISKTPLFLIGGVCFVIVLVGITGVTLINNLNLSNIIKLNEKVASDSMSAPHDTELNDDEDVSDDDINNYANNHPKNIYKFDETSAPYALAVGQYAHAASLASLTAAASGATASSTPQHITVSNSEETPENMQPPLAGRTLTLIGHPAVGLVDSEANNGNRMSESLPETQRQQNMDTSAYWLKVNGKWISNDRGASSGVNTFAINDNVDGSTVEESVNNLQVNRVQSQASTSLASTSPSTSSDESSFTNETPASTSATTAATSIASSSVPSVTVDLAAKFMLPLILNGSASVTQDINNRNPNEEQSAESDAIWGFPSDNNQTINSEKFATKKHNGGRSGDNEEKRAYVRKKSKYATMRLEENR